MTQTASGEILEPRIERRIDRTALLDFARATGQTDPVYMELDAARTAGHPDLPVPPTYLFGLRIDRPDPFSWLVERGVDTRYLLHGSEKFDYHSVAHAGDVVTLVARLTENYTKRDGQLQFFVLETTVTRGEDAIATLVETLIVRQPESVGMS